jgi:hypothetical protein
MHGVSFSFTKLMLGNATDSSGWAAWFKRKQDRTRINTVQRRRFAAVRRENKTTAEVSQQAFHDPSTGFQQQRFLTRSRSGFTLFKPR